MNKIFENDYMIAYSDHNDEIIIENKKTKAGIKVATALDELVVVPASGSNLHFAIIEGLPGVITSK